MNWAVKAKNKYKRYYQLKYLVQSIRNKNQTCNHIETVNQWMERVEICYE